MFFKSQYLPLLKKKIKKILKSQYLFLIVATCGLNEIMQRQRLAPNKNLKALAITICISIRLYLKQDYTKKTNYSVPFSSPFAVNWQGKILKSRGRTRSSLRIRPNNGVPVNWKQTDYLGLTISCVTLGKSYMAFNFPLFQTQGNQSAP